MRGPEALPPPRQTGPPVFHTGARRRNTVPTGGTQPAGVATTLRVRHGCPSWRSRHPGLPTCTALAPPNLGWGPHMCRKDPLAGRVGRNNLRALAPLGPEAGERETNAGPEAYGPRLGCNQPCHTNPPLGTQPWGTVGSGVQPTTLLLLQGGCLRTSGWNESITCSELCRRHMGAVRWTPPSFMGGHGMSVVPPAELAQGECTNVANAPMT